MKTDFQSLTGILNFACLVVTPGLALLRRLIDPTCHVGKPQHRNKLTTEGRSDITGCQIFMEHFNEKDTFTRSVGFCIQVENV